MWTKEGRLAIHRMASRQVALDDLIVRLAKAFTGTADEDIVFADVTECDFDAYAALTNPLWDPPVINGFDQAEGKSELLTWTAGGAIVSQTIVAVYIDYALDDATNVLAWIKKISPTVTLATPAEVFQRYIDLFADDIAAYD